MSKLHVEYAYYVYVDKETTVIVSDFATRLNTANRLVLYVHVRTFAVAGLNVGLSSSFFITPDGSTKTRKTQQ